MDVVARRPSLAAVIVIGPPLPTPVTKPFGDTFAICGSADDQVTPRDTAACPTASIPRATSCVDWHELIQSVAAVMTIELGRRGDSASGTVMSSRPRQAVRAVKAAMSVTGRMLQPPA